MSTQASEQSWTAQLLGWAEGVMLALGYPGLALLIVIEQLIPLLVPPQAPVATT